MLKNKKEIVKDKTLEVANFNNSVEKVVEYYLLNEYTSLSKKLFKSKLIFIFLSLSTMIMTTTITILTMFVIGKQIGGTSIQSKFVIISIVSATITLIAGIDGIFIFKKKKEMYLNRIEELNNILNYIDDRHKKKRDFNHIAIRVNEKIANLEKDKSN